MTCGTHDARFEGGLGESPSLTRVVSRIGLATAVWEIDQARAAAARA